MRSEDSHNPTPSWFETHRFGMLLSMRVQPHPEEARSAVSKDEAIDVEKATVAGGCVSDRSAVATAGQFRSVVQDRGTAGCGRLGGRTQILDGFALG